MSPRDSDLEATSSTVDPSFQNYTRERKVGLSREVAADVARVPLSIVNVYLLGPTNARDRGWVLADAGMPWSESRIRRATAERFGVRSRPSAIVRTHDHFGLVARLAEEWDCPVYAHELELPYLTGRSSYPPPEPAVGGGTMSFLSRTYLGGGCLAQAWALRSCPCNR